MEYFFLVSGYFAFSHVEKHINRFAQVPAKEIGRYCCKKWLHFLPFSLVTCVIAYGYYFATNELPFKEDLKRLGLMVFESLLLRNTGINDGGVAAILWYLSAMLVTLPVVLYIAVKCRDLFRYYLALIFPLFVYAFLIRQVGSIRTTDYVLSDLRAAAGLALGGFVYFTAEKLRAVPWTDLARQLLLICEIIFLAAACVMTLSISMAKTRYDAYFVLLMFLSLSISFSGVTATARFSSAAVSYLGKISFPLYCLHPCVLSIVRDSGLPLRYQMLIVYAGSLLVACFAQWAVDAALPRLQAGFRRYLIRQNAPAIQ